MIGKNDKYKKQKISYVPTIGDHPIIGDDLDKKPLYGRPYKGTS